MGADRFGRRRPSGGANSTRMRRVLGHLGGLGPLEVFGASVFFAPRGQKTGCGLVGSAPTDVGRLRRVGSSHPQVLTGWGDHGFAAGFEFCTRFPNRPFGLIGYGPADLVQQSQVFDGAG